MAIVSTIFGDPHYARRLRNLVRLPDRNDQLEFLVGNFTEEKLMQIVESLVEKCSGRFTEEETELLQLLGEIFEVLAFEEWLRRSRINGGFIFTRAIGEKRRREP